MNMKPREARKKRTSGSGDRIRDMLKKGLKLREVVRRELEPLRRVTAKELAFIVD